MWNVLEVLRPTAGAHGCGDRAGLGARRLAQLQDNLAAVDVELREDEIRRLDEVSELPPEYPGRMLSTQGADRWGVTDLWRDRVAPVAGLDLAPEGARHRRPDSLPCRVIRRRQALAGRAADR
ncbi:hypothetical protein SAMN05421835_13251 [Amycolatopsis sacchari]|uniref:Aldo/keto reductase family protein n=1 Tax=Amycolatopsis sacchari TaxID=115433 RepID=A0A1I4C5Y5_9PSEU|nr:hypothetical protein SAMN05421835_13251 [Amycolatopsis sacchari]